MTERLNEDVFPTVSIDIAYGQKVWDFDVNLDLITQHLRSRGMSDEQINELTIHFSPKKFEPTDKKAKKRQKDSKYETLGRFFKEDKHIDIHKPQSWFSYYAEGGELKGMGIHVDKLTGDELSETLVHELEHYIQTIDNEIQDDVKLYDKWRTKLLRGRLGDTALKHVVVFSGIATSSIFASDAVEKSLASFDGFTNGTASTAISVATLGAYFVASRLMSRELDDKANTLNREAYLHRPSEVAARYAEEEYPLKLVTLETIPTGCETYADVMKQVQDSFTNRIVEGITVSVPQTTSSPLK